MCIIISTWGNLVSDSPHPPSFDMSAAPPEQPTHTPPPPLQSADERAALLQRCSSVHGLLQLQLQRGGKNDTGAPLRQDNLIVRTDLFFFFTSPIRKYHNDGARHRTFTDAADRGRFSVLGTMGMRACHQSLLYSGGDGRGLLCCQSGHGFGSGCPQSGGAQGEAWCHSQQKLPWHQQRDGGADNPREDRPGEHMHD